MKTHSRYRRTKSQRGHSLYKSSLPTRRDVLLLGATGVGLLLVYAVRLDVGFGLHAGLVSWVEWLSRSLLLGLLLVGLAAYLWVQKPALFKRDLEKHFFVGLILVDAVLTQLLGALSPYLTPVALSVGLVVMFFDAEVGLVLALFQAGLVGFSAPSPVAAVVLLAGAVVMLLRARRLERSRELILIGLETGLVHIVVLVAFNLFGGWDSGVWRWQQLAAAGLNGPINALLLIGLIPLVEYVLQRTSPLGLIELLNTSHPLLERLAGAPGTYQHSLSVARLASAAARAIGADALRTQVGALYHDIGKAAPGVRSTYFAENQRDGHNPHDDLPPNISRIILVNHVKAGLEMGQAGGLKQDVLQFIAEHHGTTVIRFFYIKALKDPEHNASLSLDDYRYEGPRPQSKETAILMICDAMESASRSLSSFEQVDDVLSKIVRERLEDGQFDQCPLTMDDLTRVKASVQQTLRSMMHTRPRYPDASAMKTPVAGTRR